MKTVLLILLRAVLRVAFGLYRTPKLSPQCIVVSNHNTHLDVYVLSMLFRWSDLHRVRSAAAADTFKSGPLARIARGTLNLILVERRAPQAHDPLEEVRGALKEGASLIIFPEGTRDKPGVILPFKPGIGEIARSFPQIPIYPCFIAGIERVWPRGSWLPLPFNVDVLVGEPFRGDPNLHRRDLAKQLEEKVRELAERYEKNRRSEPTP